MSIAEEIHIIREEIAKLEQQKKQRYKQIELIRFRCIHDFAEPLRMYEEDIYVCKVCGYEDSRKRSM